MMPQIHKSIIRRYGIKKSLTLFLLALFSLASSVPAHAQGMTYYITHAQDQTQRAAGLLGAAEAVREGLGDEI